MPDVQVDRTRVLIAGHSGGGSTAPYVATNDELYASYAVLHGGVFAGGLGKHAVRGWFSTGDQDPLRPPPGVQKAASDAREAGIGSVEYRVFHEGHEMGAEEIEAVVRWWLEG
jgi:predicted esterase